MFANPDFGAFEPRPQQRFPKLSIQVTAEFSDQTPFVSQIYAAAWNIAQRDHEIDKLFNFEYYQSENP